MSNHVVSCVNLTRGGPSGLENVSDDKKARLDIVLNTKDWLRRFGDGNVFPVLEDLADQRRLSLSLMIILAPLGLVRTLTLNSLKMPTVSSCQRWFRDRQSRSS